MARYPQLLVLTVLMWSGCTSTPTQMTSHDAELEAARILLWHEKSRIDGVAPPVSWPEAEAVRRIGDRTWVVDIDTSALPGGYPEQLAVEVSAVGDHPGRKVHGTGVGTEPTAEAAERVFHAERVPGLATVQPLPDGTVKLETRGMTIGGFGRGLIFDQESGEFQRSSDIDPTSLIAKVEETVSVQGAIRGYALTVVAIEANEVRLRIEGPGHPHYPAGLYVVAPYAQPSTGWQPSGAGLEVMLTSRREHWLPSEGPRFTVFVRHIGDEKITAPRLIHGIVYINDVPYAFIPRPHEPREDIQPGDLMEWGSIYLDPGDTGNWRQVLEGRNLGDPPQWQPGQYRVRFSVPAIETAELEITIVDPQGR